MSGLYNDRARRTLRQYCEEEPRVAFLLEQWHPEKNGELTPDDVSQSSRRVVWWRCEKGHEWCTQAASRRYGTGCPVCRQQKLTQRREDKEKRK